MTFQIYVFCYHCTSYNLKIWGWDSIMFPDIVHLNSVWYRSNGTMSWCMILSSWFMGICVYYCQAVRWWLLCVHEWPLPKAADGKLYSFVIESCLSYDKIRYDCIQTVVISMWHNDLAMQVQGPLRGLSYQQPVTPTPFCHFILSLVRGEVLRFSFLVGQIIWFDFD